MRGVALDLHGESVFVSAVIIGQLSLDVPRGCNGRRVLFHTDQPLENVIGYYIKLGNSLYPTVIMLLLGYDLKSVENASSHTKNLKPILRRNQLKL